jgi:Cu(I)/Ag(I) efflux system protein CusF
MRKTLLIAIAAFCLSAGPAPSALAQSGMIEGQVIKVDPSAGKITIKHGPIKKFDMDEGMTMVWAAEPSMLDGVKAGDKIKFEPDRVKGQFTVTKIQKVR